MPKLNQKESTLSDSSAPLPKKDSLFAPLRIQNTLLVATLAQLVLAILLYMLASTSPLALLIEGAIAVALALFSINKAQSRRTPRIVLRTLFILCAVLPLVVGAVASAGTFSQNQDALLLEAVVWMTLAVIVLPPLLLLQPVLALNARSRRRFDLVLVRVLAIVTFLLTLTLCVFALEFKLDDPLILTSITYMPSVFGQDMVFTIAIDCLFTRILFCVCSGVSVAASFLLHPPSGDDRHKRMVRK